MDEVRHDVVEKPLVVGHHHVGVVRPLERIDPVGHDPKGIDIQSRVRLVEQRELGLEHGHLENLVSLLLATREPGVHGPLHDLGTPLDHLQLLLQQIDKVDRVHFLQPASLPHLIVGRPEKVRVRDAGNFDRVLKSQKHPGLSSFLRLKLGEVGSPE